MAKRSFAFKLDRAHEHAMLLNDELGAYLKRHPHAFVTEQSPEPAEGQLGG